MRPPEKRESTVNNLSAADAATITAILRFTRVVCRGLAWLTVSLIKGLIGVLTGAIGLWMWQRFGPGGGQ